LHIFQRSFTAHHFNTMKLSDVSVTSMSKACVHHIVTAGCRKTRNYAVGVASNGVTFLQNFVKIRPLVKKLRDTQTW